METLQALAKHYKLFLVSNCQDGYEIPFLNFPGLEGLFCDHETAGRSGLSKAENIKLVCSRSGLHHPLYVGDTAGDMAAAREAGVPFVHAAYGFGTVPEGTPADDEELDCPPEVGAAVACYVAAHLAMEDDQYLHGALHNEFERKLARLQEGAFLECGLTEDAYG